ncbi:MAG: dihydrofolate reductase [Succinivibrio sp.]|nr:dihydrofolate reductase [Succinivibrio sp.]
MSTELQLVAALSDNRVIGRDGQIPWHLREDLQHFKALTLNHPVLMGRRTFESIGRVLPRRRNILLSSSFSAELAGLEIVKSLAEARALTASEPLPLMIIGGARLYEETLPLCSTLHLTRVHLEVAGDTYFPEFDAAAFKLCASEEFFSEQAQCRYTFETWQRV